MEKYKVKKTLNNNVVIAERGREELILVGKAIGFDFPKGSYILDDRIENKFIKESSTSGNNYEKILQIIDNKIIGISEEIITLCEKELGLKLNVAIHVSLPDHINFAIRRIEKGVAIENPFLNELTVLYPREYELAAKALNMINENFNVKLPQDEIGFICLHIRAAIMEQSVTEPLAYTKKLGEIMDLICKLINKEINKNSLEYARTITHINFMLERVISKKTIKNYLLESIKKELYKEYDLAIKVSFKIESLFSVKIPEDELGFIAMHLRRITEL